MHLGRIGSSWILGGALVAGLAAHGGEVRDGQEVTQLLPEAAGPDAAGEAGGRAVGGGMGVEAWRGWGMGWGM